MTTMDDRHELNALQICYASRGSVLSKHKFNTLQFVMPAQAGNQRKWLYRWMPACAGMTNWAALNLSWTAVSADWPLEVESLSSMRVYAGVRDRIFLILLALLCLSFALGCNNSEIVVDNLLQREANEVLVLLRDHKIEAQKIAQASKKQTTYEISVKKDHAEEALRLLVHHQMPQVFRAGLKEVYPPGSAGIIPTKSDELARMMMAMQGEIEALLKIIPGVADARVVISYDPPIDYHRTTTKKTASVALIFRAQDTDKPPPLNEVEIKNLIAASISGITADDVTVVQKMLEQPKTPVKPENVLVMSKTKEESPAPWHLMVLTIAALLIASYAIVRLFLQRKSLASAS